jgi:hypothetical protein
MAGEEDTSGGGANLFWGKYSNVVVGSILAKKKNLRR